MRRAERLFQLVLLLQRRNVITAARLADRLQVSERTVYRDIRALNLSGVPIEGEAGVGYVLRHGFELPPLMFSAEEASALILGARMVQAWGDPELEKAAQRVLDKVSTVVPPDIQAKFADRTLAVPGFHIASSIREDLGLTRTALNGHRKIRFGYTRRDGAETTRTVRPLGLFYWGDSWSLAAWCEKRNDFRNFRIDRMSDLRLLKSPFAAEEGKTLDDYLRIVESE